MRFGRWTRGYRRDRGSAPSCECFSMSAAPVTESYLLIDELEETLASGNARDCGRMLARVADLFVHGSDRYTDEQIALFDDVLLRLSAEIEMQARARLAQRLAYMDNAPPKLIRAFAFDDAIDVARPVLSFSSRLSDADLAESARLKSQEHLYAIGRRASLSEAVTDVLVERGSDRVVRALARNAGAHFSPLGFGKLVTRASKDGVLAFGMVQRTDLPREVMVKLIETASANVRAVLEATNPQAVDAVREAVDAAATAIRREAMAPARGEEFAKTVAALVKLGGFSPDLVERALAGGGIDMVLIFAKAARCSWATTKDLLAQFAGKRGISPDDLRRASVSFDQLSPETAKSILKFRLERVPGPQSQPVQGPAKVAVLPVTPARRGKP
jgi:uncharacterized protein (DUF2336 family)